MRGELGWVGLFLEKNLEIRVEYFLSKNLVGFSLYSREYGEILVRF